MRTAVDESADAPEAHIASLVIHVRPEHLAALTTALTSLDGADIHATDPAGKLIVTLEADDESMLIAQMDQIDRCAGVLGTRLVYHHKESPEALQEIVAHDHDPS